ncbi:Uncharacterised protein [Legionella lansingensis]|uniref:Uncharacterized protein n=1 Tax=Legionella lansingensis TaxID=45067 RepID=A0A0W0VF52_9GAMM|nr:hypothetical protein [Legionella lansingensis]KTD18722.1 hypothetical protein Llan_2325 [Legionella lansingensis]SNV58035.1 Uncharacterised protein [Legionella lansingensis]
MARNRMIKSEFWTSEQVMSCSPLARLMFIGLWNYADDRGIHKASYKKLKAEVFPYDDYSLDDIQNWISELIQQKLLHEYTVDGQAYWIVTGWSRHQKINKPTYRYPVEASLIPTKLIHNHLMNTNESISDYSTTPTSPVSENLLKGCDEIEKKEKRKGKEKHIREVETSPVGVLEANSFASKQIFEYWQTTMNHPRAKFDRKRQRVITTALRNYSTSELKQAIDGCKNTPYNMGKNDSGQVYDDICLILRDAEHIERFINNGVRKNTESTYIASNDLMAGVI